MEIGPLMGYSAIFAGIAVAWGKIKMVFSHISSFLVETYTFDTVSSFEMFIGFIGFE